MHGFLLELFFVRRSLPNANGPWTDKLSGGLSPEITTCDQIKRLVRCGQTKLRAYPTCHQMETICIWWGLLTCLILVSFAISCGQTRTRSCISYMLGRLACSIAKRCQDIAGWAENDRGVSFIFGPDVVSTFLQMLGSTSVSKEFCWALGLLGLELVVTQHGHSQEAGDGPGLSSSSGQQTTAPRDSASMIDLAYSFREGRGRWVWILCQAPAHHPLQCSVTKLQKITFALWLKRLQFLGDSSRDI